MGPFSFLTKTPKRYPATMSVYATHQDLLYDRARWKRKNRIAQLKRTIARLEAENCKLEYLSTRITYEGTMQEMLTFLPTP